jgi:GNAT superfamily N-acetyltransferase
MRERGVLPISDMKSSSDENESGYRIRAMTSEDAGPCAGMRNRLLPGAFVNSLGETFLRTIYFRTMAESSHCLGYVCTLRDKPVGFFTLAADYAALRAEMVRKGWLRATFVLGARFLCHPLVFLRFVKFLFADRPDVHSEAPAEIMGIAVEPEHRGRGVAHDLLRRGLAELDEAFGCACRVQTWGPEAAGAKVYQDFGFGDSAAFSMFGREYAMLVRAARVG